MSTFSVFEQNTKLSKKITKSLQIFCLGSKNAFTRLPDQALDVCKWLSVVKHFQVAQPLQRKEQKKSN